MILEIDDKIILEKSQENALLVYDASKKSFCLKTYETINYETSNRIKKLENSVLDLSFKMNRLIKEERVIEKLNDLINKFNNDDVKKYLINNVALFLLFLDLQINNVNENVDLEAIINWCKNPNNDTPNDLKSYINLIDKKNEVINNDK